MTITSVRTALGTVTVDVEGQGPPALLWHSLFVDSAMWSRIRTELARERTLVLIDGPGHGGSGPPPSTSRSKTAPRRP